MVDLVNLTRCEKIRGKVDKLKHRMFGGVGGQYTTHVNLYSYLVLCE